MAEISKLLKYSIGIVAVNKTRDSNVIEVTPIEDSPMLNGELTDNATTTTTKSQDSTGKPFSTTVTTTATVKATWLPKGDPNRRTSPDVRRGHKVQLYRYADTDEFFWEVLTDAGGLMKLETVTHSYSGTADENATNDASNSYFTHISTHDGLVAIHTSKANNEPYGYDGQINTAQGVVQLQDDIGNSFYMNSKEHQLEVQNADGALISMKGPDIVINAPASLTIKAGTTITINGVGITIDGSGNVNITSPNTTVN